MGITYTYINRTLGSKGTTKTSFTSTTRGFDMGFKLSLYVKKDVIQARTLGRIPNEE